RQASCQRRKVTMRTSASNMDFARLPWAQPPAPAQFHPELKFDARSVVQSEGTDEPVVESRTEPVRAARTEVSFGRFRLLPAQFLLLKGNKPVPLGSRALEVLVVLLERPSELVSGQELMGRVWPNTFVEPANLRAQISALRRALRDGRDG